MTARPQENVVNNIALLPLPDVFYDAYDNCVDEDVLAYARANVAAALASAQAREEELRVALTLEKAGAEHERIRMTCRIERLEEVIKNVLRYRKGEGDYNFSHLTGQARDMAALESWEQLELYMERLLSNEA